jgi:hypothetical protein
MDKTKKNTLLITDRFSHPAMPWFLLSHAFFARGYYRIPAMIMQPMLSTICQSGAALIVHFILQYLMEAAKNTASAMINGTVGAGRPGPAPNDRLIYSQKKGTPVG